MDKTKYAYILEVTYRWPDEDRSNWHIGSIVFTNTTPEEAVEMCGIPDNEVLIYTDSLDFEYIRRNFDGLIIYAITAADTYYQGGADD